MNTDKHRFSNNEDSCAPSEFIRVHRWQNCLETRAASSRKEDESILAGLFAEFEMEDLMLADQGMTEYGQALAEEDLQ